MFPQTGGEIQVSTVSVGWDLGVVEPLTLSLFAEDFLNCFTQFSFLIEKFPVSRRIFKSEVCAGDDLHLFGNRERRNLVHFRPMITVVILEWVCHIYELAKLAGV